MTLGVLKVFDEVIPLSKLNDFNVDTRVFWSYPKLRVLLTQTEPVYLVDHDFMVFDDIRTALDSGKICYNYTEDGRNYYPSNMDSIIKGMQYRTRWPDYSANVSFLYLPFPDWTRFYAGTSIGIMEDLTGKATNSRYLIFAEQMVLKHLLDGMDYQCLLKDIYTCKVENWSKESDPNGIWTWQEALWHKFIHYGPVKRRWNKGEYDKEMKWLCEVSGLGLNFLERTNYLRK